MAEDTTYVPQSLTDLKTLDQGTTFLYVLNMPALEAHGETLEAREMMCIPIFIRRSGVLMAVPEGALPSALVSSAAPISAEELVGPSKVVRTEAVMEMEDGSERALGTEITLLLVDFHADILGSMRQMDPVTDMTGILSFATDIDVFPASTALLDAAVAWLEESQEDRVLYYSAGEESPVSSTVPLPKQPATKAKAKATPAKKVTTAALSEQLAALAHAIPAISSQLQALQNNPTSRTSACPSKHSKQWALQRSSGRSAPRQESVQEPCQAKKRPCPQKTSHMVCQKRSFLPQTFLQGRSESLGL